MNVEVWNHRFAEIAEEMGETLRRAALSPNIRERRDYSAAIFDGQGRLWAQAAHIPVHLGSMATAVCAVIDAELGDGVAIVNDPYAGGTHLPDVTLVTRAVGGLYVAVRAHHADVGGITPGSMPVGARADVDALAPPSPPPAVGPRYAEADVAATGVTFRALTIDDEGFRIAPALLDDDVAERFCAASRAPDERRGNLAAQRAALDAGRAGLARLAARHGVATLYQAGAALIDYTARLITAEVAAIPNGVYAFADSLDDDGAGARDLGIRVTIGIDGGVATFDFGDSDLQTAGSLNAVPSVTLAAVAYALRLLLPPGAPTNEGLLAAARIAVRPGTLVAAAAPAAVSAGNVETSQRIVDVILGALAQALPTRIPAASAGTMSNVLIGGADWAYYETIAGGSGASSTTAGASAVQTHMTNTRNTPVEELERSTPLRVVSYALRRGSGGGGAHFGGDGIVREFELTADAEVTLIADRRRHPPYGLAGGGPGALGQDTLTRAGRVVALPSKITFAAVAGDRLRIETPGGGGHTDPTRAAFWDVLHQK